MAVLPNEEALLKKAINDALKDISRPNAFRLKAGLRILSTTNLETFQNVCSANVQNDLFFFKNLVMHPETIAPISCQSIENKKDTLQLIQQSILENLSLLDQRTSILPNTYMVQKSIMEGEHLKSVVHTSALRNVIMSAHYFEELAEKLRQENIPEARIESMVEEAKLYTDALHKAVLEGNISAVLKCVSIHGVDINFPNEQGLTPLHLAVREGLTETVKILLTVPEIKPNRLSTNGWTPLHMAARLGHTEIVSALLSIPAVDVNAVNSDGWSSLHWAAWHGFTETVNTLVGTPGIKINLTDRNHTTPLHLAARNGHPKIIKLLLAMPDIQVNAVDNEIRTPLQLAVIYCHAEAASVLLKNPEVEVNLPDIDGLTPLHWAARNGDITLLNHLLGRSDIIPYAQDKSAMTPLKWAIQNHHDNLVRLLKPYTPNEESSFDLINKLLKFFKIKLIKSNE